jgi:hypothetical protein
LLRLLTCDLPILALHELTACRRDVNPASRSTRANASRSGCGVVRHCGADSIGLYGIKFTCTSRPFSQSASSCASASESFTPASIKYSIMTELF